ncbi:DUF6236 family protein [Janthinobacterium lividum]
MGEAKQRAKTEKNFGKIPKERSKRGLIVSSPIKVEGNSVRFIGGGLDSQELRFALLFWDKLVWPSTAIMGSPPTPDEQFLLDAGILTRPRYQVNGDIAREIARTQFAAFNERNNAEPGCWAMSQGERAFLYIGENQLEGGGAALELHRAIPIPAHDVPLNEILEFKERRKDELWLLRDKLDSFVSELETEQDRDASMLKNISEIDQACSNLLILGKEWQFPVHLSNLKTSFSLTAGKFIPAAKLGLLAGLQYGLVAAGAAAGVAGLASTLEIKGDFGLRGLKKPASPYKYAYHIERELK